MTAGRRGFTTKSPKESSGAPEQCSSGRDQIIPASGQQHAAASHRWLKPMQIATRCGKIERAGAQISKPDETAKNHRSRADSQRITGRTPLAKIFFRRLRLWHAGCISWKAVGDLRVSDTH
jgi:hypothetical protein